MPKPRLDPPFSYFGGKRRVADLIWSRLGNPDVFCEPFSGSLAVMLARPGGGRGVEVTADTCGLIANFWRAIIHDPQGVAEAADYPPVHDDLVARDKYLKNWAPYFGPRLRSDARYYDAEAAGWWAWGQAHACWGVFGRSDPTVSARIDFGQNTVARTRKATPFYDPAAPNRLGPWFDFLSARLAKVVVLNRDWLNTVKPTYLGRGGKSIAVFLDPPYAKRGDVERKMYHTDFEGDNSTAVADAAWEWALEHGHEWPIAYADYDAREAPDGWETVKIGQIKIRTRNPAGEVIHFSPACKIEGRLL